MSLAILRRGMRPGGMTFSGTHMDPERIQLGEKMKNVCILGAGSLSFFFGFFLTYLAQLCIAFESGMASVFARGLEERTVQLMSEESEENEETMNDAVHLAKPMASGELYVSK